ncbi:hypothetical protein [Marisediminicola sp. LYQ134]|uniref:hypothetical protein n=1 Tax=Marisediminicola sp. LYQ134 TaxID=3391061 RepID=UPI0039831A6C
MQWWNDFLEWFGSNDGQTVVVSAIIPFVAIVVAGLVAALIGRGSTKRLITLNDRENRIAAVATMIGAARKASVWNTLSVPEQQHADHVASEADVRVRLLAVPGSGLAADWAAHQIASMKNDSISFSFQAEQSLLEFRDRMVTWQAKPSRAKKLFKNDLELWAYEDSKNSKDLVTQQEAWAAGQASSGSGSAATPPPADTAPAAAPRSLAPRAGASNPVPLTPPVASAPSAQSPAAVIENDPATTVAMPASPELVEPTGAPRPASASTPPTQGPSPAGEDDDLAEDRGDDIYSPPVNANSVSKRINPPHVGDDGR